MLWKEIVHYSFYRQAREPVKSNKKITSHKACTHLSPGTPTWMDEFRRLAHHVPQLLLDDEHVHSGGVTDVQFSEDGSMFATCGQDGR